MKVAPGDWTQETLGAWLLAVRDSDFDGRGVDIGYARKVVNTPPNPLLKGSYAIQGLPPSKVGETLTRVLAAVEVIKVMGLTVDYRIEMEATDMVNKPESHNLGTLREIIKTVEDEPEINAKLSASLFHLVLGDAIPRRLQETPIVADILQKRLGIPSLVPPAVPKPFDPFEL